MWLSSSLMTSPLPVPQCVSNECSPHMEWTLISTYLVSLRMYRKIKKSFLPHIYGLDNFFYLSEYIETIMSNNLNYYLTISFLIWSMLILEHECSPVTLLITICNVKILFYYTGKQRWKVPFLLDLEIIFHIWLHIKKSVTATPRKTTSNTL